MLPKCFFLAVSLASSTLAADAAAAGAGWGGHGGWGGGGGGWGGGPPAGGWGGGGWGGAGWGGGAPPGAPNGGGGPWGPGGWGWGPGAPGTPGAPQCWEQCYKDVGVQENADLKTLCTQSKQPDFLSKLQQRACVLCKNDASGLDYATKSLPNLQSKCQSIGIPIPQDVYDKAKDATKCNGQAPPPSASTKTVTATSVIPTPTVVLPTTISSTTTVYSPGGTLPPPTGGGVTYATYTSSSTSTTVGPGTFSQGLSTTTFLPSTTKPAPFLGAGERVRVGWLPFVFFGALAL